MKLSQIKTSDDKTYQKPSAARQAGAFAVGGAIVGSEIYRKGKRVFAIPSDAQIDKNAVSAAKMMPDIDTFENIKTYAEDILQKRGLADKGVKIYWVNGENSDVLKKKLIGITDSPHIKKVLEAHVKVIEKGANASFINGEVNGVAVGCKQLFSSVFHELGHAHNKNCSVFFRGVQSLMGFSPAGIPIIGAGLFLATLLHNVKPEKVVNGKKIEKSREEKTLDFCKNHAGTITFATMVPLLIEEAGASIKGVKFAKEYYKTQPEKISLLKKGYVKAFKTYGKSALRWGVAVGAANIIATAIQRGSILPPRKEALPPKRFKTTLTA